MLENYQNLKRHWHLEVYKSSRVWHQEKHASETVDELLQIWLDHLLFESQTQETLSAKGQWPSAFEEQNYSVFRTKTTPLDSPQLFKIVMWAVFPVSWWLQLLDRHCRMGRMPPMGWWDILCAPEILLLGVLFSNYLFPLFCLKKATQKLFYNIHFPLKTYEVLPTRGVWRKGHPVKGIIVPLEDFFFPQKKFFIVQKAHWALVSL